MKALKPVAIRSATALTAVVADSLESVEPGLAVLERGFAAGETLVDIVALDSERRLVTVVVEVDADAALVVRALEAAAWCRENGPLLSRVFAGADVDPAAPPRPFLVARRLGDRALRFLKALGPMAPAALECLVFELNGERCVSYEDVTRPGGRAYGRSGTPGGRREPVSTAPPSGDAPGSRAHPSVEPREPVEQTQAERARKMIERLEALRFGQAFQ